MHTNDNLFELINLTFCGTSIVVGHFHVVDISNRLNSGLYFWSYLKMEIFEYIVFPNKEVIFSLPQTDRSLFCNLD